MPTSSRSASLTLFPVPGHGTEDVLVSPTGLVYTGTDDGAIHEVDPESGLVRVVARTDGRPLGLEWLPDGRLLICDAAFGLLAATITTGEVEMLVDEVEGAPLRFLNNAAVLPDGTVFFTDSSTVHPIADWKGEVVEDTGTGRLLRRDPDGTVSVVVDHLRFANGVMASADAAYVVVAELNARTLHRHWLSGERAGRTEVFAADLPGYPDNISLGSDGLVWVAVASPRDPVLETLHRRAPLWLRRKIWRLPEALQPKVKRTVRVQAYDEAGRLARDYDLDAGAFHMATGVREHEGTVWVGSLDEPAIASFPR